MKTVKNGVGESHSPCTLTFFSCMCVRVPAAGYREIVMQALPQISVLDGLDRLGDPSHPNLVSPCDIPGLEDYVDLLLSSDTSRNEVVIIYMYIYI